MAHTYVVASATFIPNLPGIADPQVTIVGAVDGVPVTVQLWLSAIQAAHVAGGIVAVKNLVAPLMLAQATINNPPPPQAPVELGTGTFVQ